MKSLRSAVGWSLGLVAIVVSAAWLASDRSPGVASTPPPTASQSDANGTAENEKAFAPEMPEQPPAAEPVAIEAPAPADFSGTWQLDAKASDPLDPILAAMGVSIIERTLINNSVVTHVISQTADELTIEMKSAFFGRFDHLPLDGQPAQTVDPAGRPVESVSVWSDDGKRLITEVWMEPDRQKFTTTRSIDAEHDRMELLIEFFPKDGKPLTSRRVYHRVEAPAAGKSS